MSKPGSLPASLLARHSLHAWLTAGLALVSALAALAPWAPLPEGGVAMGFAHGGWLVALLALAAGGTLFVPLEARLRGVASALLFAAACILALRGLMGIPWADAHPLGAPLSAAASFSGFFAALWTTWPSARTPLRWWEPALLGSLGGFMFWVRMLPYQVLVGGDRVHYIGTDPYYHYRETLGIVRAFPDVPRYDPFTYYPWGTGTGQFGSLFDWLAAAFIVLTRGTGASEAYVAQVLGVFPALLGALLIVPFYFLARRLVGRAGAVVSSLTLALLGGEFLIRSIAGYSDHHVAENLFSVLALLGIVVAAERSEAAWIAGAKDLRAWATWRTPLLWGALGGLALAANFYAWPPAILFLGIALLWLTAVLILDHGRGKDPTGYVMGAAVAFVVSGLLLLPAIETANLAEFNTYGLLQPLSCVAAALWLATVHAAALALRRKGVTLWALPATIAGLALAGFFTLRAAAPSIHGSFMWGLSWITGFGVQRTLLTIAEARTAEFFCTDDLREASCLATDFGMLAPVGVFILLALALFVLWKRRRNDILLLVWSFLVFRAAATQIRFSYYLAVNLALLLGWLAARVHEAAGGDAGDPEAVLASTPVKVGKGRKTRQIAAQARAPRPWRPMAVALVILLVLPGNVIGNERMVPPWEMARIGAPDGDLVVWTEGLLWMRENTPDAGVDLGLIATAPPSGARYDYPDRSYGVLSWWDYGHWIETLALRPPVANPFQQAAPFASTWFTERDPDRAEALLDEWVGDQPPVRYVWIDDAMATGKYGAITVWAHSQNDSRAVWAGGEYITSRTYRENGANVNLPTLGPEYTESMMGRLFDGEGAGLPHYRLVWEFPGYGVLANVATDSGQLRCLHEMIPSRGCAIGIREEFVRDYQPGTLVPVGIDARLYDIQLVSRLKLFERVEGARLVGQTQPHADVTASLILEVKDGNGNTMRGFLHETSTRADETGRFTLILPYSTTDPVDPADGGTRTQVVAQGPAVVTSGPFETQVDIPDRAVLQGEDVPVNFG